MATFTSRSVTTVRREFVVPAAPPYGAAAADVGKAWSAAESEYRQLYGIPVDHALPDNAITFHPADDEVVLRFEARATPDTSEGA